LCFGNMCFDLVYHGRAVIETANLGIFCFA